MIGITITANSIIVLFSDFSHAVIPNLQYKMVTYSGGFKLSTFQSVMHTINVIDVPDAIKLYAYIV